MESSIASWSIEIRADDVPISMHVNCTKEEAETIANNYHDFWKSCCKNVIVKVNKLNKFIRQFNGKSAFFPYKKILPIIYKEIKEE